MSEENQTPAEPTPNPTPQNTPTAASLAENKLVVGILAIVLGAWGVHKFILGNKKQGIIRIAVSLGGVVLAMITGFSILSFAAIVMWIIGVVEGVLYLTKSEEEYKATYLTGSKDWF